MRKIFDRVMRRFGYIRVRHFSGSGGGGGYTLSPEMKMVTLAVGSGGAGGTGGYTQKTEPRL